MINSFPSYFSKRCVLVYLVALMIVSVMFMNDVMPLYWILLSVFVVCSFFIFSWLLSVDWSRLSNKEFTIKAFGLALFIRLGWIAIYYWITMSLWGTPWEQPIGTSMDSVGYHGEADWILELAHRQDLFHYWEYIQASGRISDMGYPVFLAILGFFTKNSIFCTRIPNAFFDAWTVILVYRLAARNFDKATARIASIFTILMPTTIFYSAVTMKESMMVMLTTWAIERGDLLIRQRKLSVKTVISFCLLAGSVFLFRTVLGIVIILSLVCALILTSNRILKNNKRIPGLLAGIVMLIMVLGGGFSQMFEGLSEDLDATEVNFEYRATRTGGNSLVGGLSKVVFVPIIFTVPFPTMINIEYQQAQQIQNGGNYIKNILSFFCVLGLLLLLISKEWKNSVILLACLVGYLIILCFSSYAHSARFHMPAIPFEMIIAAYGITHFTKARYKDYFSIFILVELAAIVVWNWFKLKGRGMV